MFKLKMKTLILLNIIWLILIILVLNIPEAGAEEAPRTMYVTVAQGSSLNLRQKPENNSYIYAAAYRGQELVVHSISPDGWAEVTNGHYFCRAEYLSDSPPSVKQGTVLSNGRVALRSSPNGRRVSWVKNGEILEIASRCVEDGITWLITLDNLYVMSDFIRMEE